jgi:hypothetical protein
VQWVFGVGCAAGEMVEIVGRRMILLLRQKSRLPGVVEFDRNLVAEMFRYDALEAFAVGVVPIRKTSGGCPNDPSIRRRKTAPLPRARLSYVCPTIL